MSSLSISISAKEARDASIDDMPLGDYITQCIRDKAQFDINTVRIHIDRGWDELDEILEDLRTLGFDTRVSEDPHGKVRHLYVSW